MLDLFCAILSLSMVSSYMILLSASLVFDLSLSNLARDSFREAIDTDGFGSGRSRSLVLYSNLGLTSVLVSFVADPSSTNSGMLKLAERLSW